MRDRPRLSFTAQTFDSPVPTAKRWIDGVRFDPALPLINVSQAAPTAPPPDALLDAMAQALRDPATHLYSPDLGRPDLRAALAEHWSRAYGAMVSSGHVAITAGCNQAFCAAIAATCGPGDAVILPTPWYFNHKMWLDMVGVEAQAVTTGPDLLPDPDVVRAAITPQTRAIVIVSPGNPTGVSYPPDLLRALYDLAQHHGLRLIVDETYRDFHDTPDQVHDLLQDPDWAGTLIQLYSFSKAYRITGHRVGALIADPGLMPEVEKFIDTVTICPNGLGQRAALFGLQHLQDFVRDEAALIAQRRDVIRAQMPGLEAAGWRLRGLGAYFAYLQHPFAAPADQVAQDLVRDAAILALPGTMFAPGGSPLGTQHLRIACANIDAAQIHEVFARLQSLDWPLAPPSPAA